MMQRFLKAVVMAATVFGSAELAQAQQKGDAPPPECRQGDRNCPPAPKRDKRHRQQRPQDASGFDDARRGDDRRGEPRPGDDRRGPPPEQLPRDARGEPLPEMRGAPPREDHAGRDPRQQHAQGRRLAPPPKGQEYRVIDDKLVLVDKKSRRILSVIGPAQGMR